MCLTLSKAKNFGINFHLQDNFWDIKETGPQIRDILKLEIFQKAASGLKNLGLLYIHQLLDKEGKRLLLWHQLKAIYPNFLSPVLSKVKISEDNKRKEWVIAEETVNRRDVRQIIAKEKTKILTEYWAFEEETEGLVQSIHPCTGCDQNQLIKADQEGRRELTFYTNGFLLLNEELKEAINAGRVQLDIENNIVIVEQAEITDELVKKALKDSNSSELNLNSFTSYILLPYWKNILIEKPLRTFIKRAFDLWNAAD
ncbi:hypothetical protein C2G38_2165602 [Gigaspora rosea]|uniref:Uncharacterized protein n=1 Tax=Gigaspora rosea TaxID=44941 RepID=A0A397VSK4_9GLOM|nr:hypothetical protein C2G38_2165601 [Gigaspora rosea]RIB25535.1 hypothetical protein C2G38_2165602 [Gigaspora rosea]